MKYPGIYWIFQELCCYHRSSSHFLPDFVCSIHIKRRKPKTAEPPNTKIRSFILVVLLGSTIFLLFPSPYWYSSYRQHSLFLKGRHSILLFLPYIYIVPSHGRLLQTLPNGQNHKLKTKFQRDENLSQLRSEMRERKEAKSSFCRWISTYAIKSRPWKQELDY